MEMNDDELYSDEINAEFENLDIAIDNLYMEMNRYENNVLYIWEEIIIPFINSSDCLTLQYLTNNHYKNFLHFMLKQSTYTLMEITMDRLIDRKYHLL